MRGGSSELIIGSEAFYKACIQTEVVTGSS